jgi:hypothetical protein
MNYSKLLPFFRYLKRIGDAASQLANVAIFFGENPNESISGRSWRLRQNRFWGKMRILVDWLASPFEADHCEKSHTNDVARAAALIKDQGL